MKKFFAVVLVFFNVAALFAIIGQEEAGNTPRQRFSHALPQTSPEWERSVLEAIPKVLAEYGENIKEAAYEYDIDWRLITGIMVVESRGYPLAKSRKGALGCMQTLPSTDVEIGVRGNSFDCITSIWKGAKYLARLRDHYKLTPRIKVIAAYVDGPGRASSYTNEDFLKHDYLNKVAFVVEHLPKHF